MNRSVIIKPSYQKLLTVPNVYPVSRIIGRRNPLIYVPSMQTLGKGIDITMTGNQAGAKAIIQAMMASRCGATPGFPISPATQMLHDVRDAEAAGIIGSIGYNAHSEHEGMAVAIGSSFAEVRTVNITSGPGLAHMFEMLEWAGQNRMKIILFLTNRAIAPLNIWFGDDDRLRIRDFSIQLVASTHQEVYDQGLQSFRIAEEVGWLTANNQAGFFLTHSSDKIKILDDETAMQFVGPYKIDPELDPFKNDISKGGLSSPAEFPLQRNQNFDAWSTVFDVVEQVHDEFAEISGRAPGAFFSTYGVDERTEYLFLNYGYLSGTLKTYVDIMRHNGIPVGLINGRLYRPFPDHPLMEAISKLPKLQTIGVFDGALDPVPGATFTDFTSALGRIWKKYSRRQLPDVINFKYGGGQNPSLSTINGALERMKEAATAGGVEYEIQQLDRNSVGGLISLDMDNQGVQKSLANQKIVEFVGRGGLGAVSAAANLVHIVNEGADLFGRGIPQFGSEKTGSPTFGIAVSEDKPITNFNIEGPRDSVVFFRSDLITQKHIFNLKDGGFFLVNTALKPAQIRKKHKIPAEIRIFTIDASKMATESLGEDYPSNVLMAAFAKIDPGQFSLDQLDAAIRNSLHGKDEEVIEANIKLINDAADKLLIEEEI